jgi:hypothetical protein
MQEFQNLLLIAGTGRNTGKTTLACEIIKQTSVKRQVIGLKISPHFHGGTESLRPIGRTDNYNLYEETLSDISGKDSSKMLASGAEQVFYIEVLDEFILEAFQFLLNHIPENTAVVCESPALRNVVIPGLFIIVDNISQQNKKQDVLKKKDIADFFIETDKTELNEVIKSIRFDSSGWGK